jgi:predicted permease
MIPMVQIRSLDLQHALGNRSWRGGARAGGLRTALVGGQVALVTVLLVSSGLLLRSISNVLSTDPGFELENVVAFAVRLPADRYGLEGERTRFEDELVARLRGIPGVDAVGTSHLSPLGGDEGSTSFRVLDAPGEAGGSRDGIAADIVGADYFRAMRIPVLKGRPLLETDTLQTPRVVVVNEAFVRRHLRGEPIGQRLSGGWRSEATPKDSPLEIVGVAANIRNASLDVAPVPRVMYASAQMPYYGKSFLLYTSHKAGALRALVQERMAMQDPELPILAYGSLADRAARSIGSRRQTAVIVGTFAGLALLLSGVGIYGVVAYVVAQRTREFGIRKALGAERTHVLGSVLGECARMVLVGAFLGVAGTLAAGRLLASHLYGISPHDPGAIAVAILALGATCLLASLVPALRAATVDPVVALRVE